jgi:hypothetical protein
MTFTIFKGFQQIERFFPRCLRRIPDEPKLFQSLYPILRQAGFASALPLSKHPYTKSKAVFHMAARNTAMSLAPIVDFQIAEAFLPICRKRIPHKPKFVQSLATFQG